MALTKEAIDEMIAKEKLRFEQYMRAKGNSEWQLRKHPLFKWYMDESVADVWCGWSEKAIYDFNES